jgi:hypothetical protein
MVKRRRGEVGVTWSFYCVEGGAPLPLTGALGVDLVFLNGLTHKLTVSSPASAGIATFTNEVDDLTEGKHKYYIQVLTSDLKIWKSLVKEAEITA